MQLFVLLCGRMVSLLSRIRVKHQQEHRLASVDFGFTKHSISPVVLFFNDDNPIYTNVTLSDSATNYSRLLIEGKDLDGFYCYTNVIDPDGKTVVLETTRCTSSTWFHLNSRVITISGNQITTFRSGNNWGNTGQANFGDGGINHTDVIAITKVLGFK